MSDPSQPVLTDSAGVPWAGRRFETNSSADDDGSAPVPLVDALREFRAGRGSESDVVDAVRGSRLLIPLLAALAESTTAATGLVADKSAELGVVTVAGPDGRTVLPVFASVEAMRRWNTSARPVPSDAVRVALAAAADSTDLVVLDPGSETEYAIRRPAIWAIAQGRAWTPSYSDPRVLAEFVESARSEPAVSSLRVEAGDPEARLAGPELVVVLRILAGLSRTDLEATVGRLQHNWARSALIAEAVDSIAVRLLPAEVS